LTATLAITDNAKHKLFFAQNINAIDFLILPFKFPVLASTAGKSKFLVTWPILVVVYMHE
jgi:hypothetical protein